MKGLSLEEIVALGMESQRIARREAVSAGNYQAPAQSVSAPAGTVEQSGNEPTVRQTGDENASEQAGEESCNERD